MALMPLPLKTVRVINVQARKVSALAQFVSENPRASLQFIVAWLAAMLVAAPQVIAHASTSLVIDTDSLFTQINTWVAALDDVIFLGVAIAIALALLLFIGNQILRAFKGSN